MKFCQRFIPAFVYVLLFLPALASGQLRQADLGLETGITAAPSQTPFWHYANTRGQILNGSQFNHYATLYGVMPFHDPASEFDVSAGIQLNSRISDTRNSAYFEQFFGAIQYRNFQLHAGRFHDEIGVGMNMTDLSTGSMIQSINATPIPKIQIRTVGFLDVPFTRGHVQYKGRYADGIMDKDRIVERPYLHQKSLYIKFNVEHFEAIAGVVHNVVWAGSHPDRGRLPQTLDDYIRVVLSKSADSESDATSSEMLNRLGNSVAAFDFAGRYTFHNTRLILYRQIYLEDTISAQVWRSLWDGTYGAGLQRIEGSGLVNSFLYEVLYTIRQDSRSILHPQGRASYYNHSVYQSGWAYRGSAIGNPLLTYDLDRQRFTNNLVIGHHIGVKGDISNELNYRFYVTYTRNYGVCADQIVGVSSCFVHEETPEGWPVGITFIPYTDLLKHQFSFLVDTSFLLHPVLGLRLKSSVAIDIGEFHGNRIGFLLGISVEDRHIFRR